QFKASPKTSPVNRLYQSRSYDIVRQGLNKETSAKFTKAINAGLVSGVDEGVSSISTDLGIPGAKLDKTTKDNFLKTVRPAIRGDFFENVLLSLKNKGKFGAAENPNRPFDFPTGVAGVLGDNFSNLPTQYIDAKSSYEAASTANLKGKIVRELKGDLIRAGILSLHAKRLKGREFSSESLKKELGIKGALLQGRGKSAGLSASALEQAGELGVGLERTSRGRFKVLASGVPSGTDTVPALLTPGEFVINQKSAKRIGYGNLKRMNAKGYAKGGAVQEFQGGGGVGFGGGALGAAAALSLAQTVTKADSAFGKLLSNLSSLAI
ncbi:uncharacterized protein METZ01_LOCUS348793, partial [marine metagenome]